MQIPLLSIKRTQSPKNSSKKRKKKEQNGEHVGEKMKFIQFEKKKKYLILLV